MEEDFYTGRLTKEHGLEVIVPDAAGRAIVHQVIYGELVRGEIPAESKKQYLEIIGQLVQAGAEGVILGCTEIGLLICQGDCRVPVFDTARIYAVAAAEYALAE